MAVEGIRSVSECVILWLAPQKACGHTCTSHHSGPRRNNMTHDQLEKYMLNCVYV